MTGTARRNFNLTFSARPGCGHTVLEQPSTTRRGGFSLTFHPDENDYTKPVFENIKVLDIIEIYESKKMFPSFTGIVRSVKYSSRIGGESGSRKVIISGHSVAGLISNFYLNMDSTAMAVSRRYKNQENVANKLTTALTLNWNTGGEKNGTGKRYG